MDFYVGQTIIPQRVKDLESKVEGQMKEHFAGVSCYTDAHKVGDLYYIDLILDRIPFNPLNHDGTYTAGFLDMYEKINNILRPQDYKDPVLIVCLDPQRIEQWKKYGWTK